MNRARDVTSFHGYEGIASGILPIARDSGFICLAWRSRWVHIGCCWGTIGGGLHDGLSVEQNAVRELAEETGYRGDVELLPAHVFSAGRFAYHTFIGLVPSTFPLAPDPTTRWETGRLGWFPLDTIQTKLRATPELFHVGVLRLFEHAEDLIARVVKESTRAGTHITGNPVDDGASRLRRGA